MGAKSTKFTRIIDPVQKAFHKECNVEETKDPRSPDIKRTPLNELKENSTNHDIGFRDPRSPTFCINRTPIVFDSDQSKSVIFEETTDTFSELFCPSPDSKSNISKNIIAEIDPRSPSLEIDRTPLNFDDIKFDLESPIAFHDDYDEEKENEDEIIQSVLDMIRVNDDEKPKNKQIERVKNMHKNKKSIEKKTKDHMSSIIYLDSNVCYSTPKKGALTEKDLLETKRTPLGCLKNKMRLRSKSLESIQNKKGETIGRFEENISKQSKCVISVFDDEAENNSIII